MPDVLDRVQVGEHRGLARRLAHADALDRELRPVARMAAPVARDVDGLARVDVRERAREDDLLAVVADAGEHGEVALLEGVAHRRHLDRQLWHRAAHGTRRTGLIRSPRMADLGAILTAIVTPFDDDLRVDEDAFVELLRHLCAHGSDGVVVCGTTGEAPTLADDEHLRLDRARGPGEARTGATVVAGTGSNDTHHAVRDDRARHRARRRRDPVGHAVLQQAQPPRPARATSRRSPAPPTGR